MSRKSTKAAPILVELASTIVPLLSMIDLVGVELSWGPLYWVLLS
jgi:hypothetical protein